MKGVFQYNGSLEASIKKKPMSTPCLAFSWGLLAKPFRDTLAGLPEAEVQAGSCGDLLVLRRMMFASAL